EAHISLGAVKLFYERNWLEAEREANRAKELNPSYANAIELNTNYGDSHHFYCQYLDAVGRPEDAILEINRALELDPLSLMLGTELGWSYYNSRQYDRAIQACRNTLERDTSFGFAYLPIGISFHIHLASRLHSCLAHGANVSAHSRPFWHGPRIRD